MICVDCKDVLPIKRDLPVHVADELEVFPAQKQNKFFLSSIENNEKIENYKVTETIQNYLYSIREVSNFENFTQSNRILIQSLNGKKINRVAPTVKSLRTCCGL